MGNPGLSKQASPDTLSSKGELLKLTEGQFENAQIKVKNAKLWNPPLADNYFIKNFQLHKITTK